MGGGVSSRFRRLLAERRLVVVFVLLCVALMNILLVSTYDDGGYGIEARSPGGDDAEALRVMVFERLNVERWRGDLNEFTYLWDERPQDHAARVLSTGDRSLNPVLKPGAGENVAYYRIEGRSLPVLVDRIVSDMAGDVAGRSRGNLFNPRFKYVSVGVAYNDAEMCVVVDFFTSPSIA